MLSRSLLAVSLAGTIQVASAWYTITGDDVNCRSGPGTSYDSVKTLSEHTTIRIECQTEGEDIEGNTIWDKTSNGCYVTDYYVETGADGYVTDKCEGSSTDSDNNSTSSGSGAKIVDTAETQLGVDYVYGGGGCDGQSSGGFDCSGLTQYSLCQALDVEIPRVAQDQYNSDLGTRYPREEAEEGDLLFWASGGDCAGSITHVGIFIDSTTMINAAKTGTPVRYQDIWEEYDGISICPEVMRYW